MGRLVRGRQISAVRVTLLGSAVRGTWLNDMEQLPFAILTLMSVSGALCVVFYLAWRTFGRMPHALTWSVMFALSFLQWALNLANALEIVPSPALHNILLSFLGATVTFLSVVGYMQRAKRHVSVPLFIGLIFITWGGSIWFLYIQPHEGIRASLLPFVIVVVCFWNMWILYDEPRKKRIVEWAVIGAYALFAGSQMIVGSIGLSQGATLDPVITQLYVTVAFLTLPTFFTLLGMFALSLIASDISTRAEVLAEYQKQKRQEEAEKSWGTVQDAIEAIPDLIGIDDGKGNFLTCNDALANFLGREKSDLIGMRSLEIIDLYREKFTIIDGERVKSSEDVVQKLWHALTTGTRLNVVTNDDRSFIVDCGYLRAGGQILVSRDVTQIYRTRARLESAISSMPIGFALFDREQQLVACNKSYENIMQHDQSWIAQQPLTTLISTLIRRLKASKSASLVERSEWLHDWMDAIENKQHQSVTALLDDDTWVDLSIRPVPGEGFVTIANDVTNRRLLEVDLEKNEAQLRQILGGQPFPVMLVRKSDNVALFASEAALEALGAKKSSLVGKPVDRYLAKPDESADVRETDDAMETGPVKEIVLKRESGESFPALFSAHDIAYAGQDARVISFIDIANIKELQSELATQREALFQSEKLNALGTLLAGVAHELNNPLTVVVANAHVLALTSEDEAVKNRIQKITDAADRCAKIIRSFLDMARKSPGERIEFDAVACVRQALDLSLYGLQEDKVEVETRIPARLPAIKGDPDQFAQVILNLIINAKQALLERDTPRKINVSMGLDKSGKQIELHVKDNGSGVPENIRDSIFDPFFTTKKVGQGTGMGLSLVRGIVKSHGGEIELVHSKKAGGHFKILIPHVGHMLAAESGVSDTQESTKQHILIVDDEPDVLAALQDILVLQGHEVFAVGSGKEALEALSSTRFDGMLSDIRMPEMDGEQLFAAIQSNHPDMVNHIAFITGNDLSEQTKAFLDTCNRPYLGKPFIPDEVAELVQDLSMMERRPS